MSETIVLCSRVPWARVEQSIAGFVAARREVSKSPLRELFRSSALEGVEIERKRRFCWFGASRVEFPRASTLLVAAIVVLTSFAIRMPPALSEASTVNFITEPLGAAVLIDGLPWLDASGAASITPITLPVPAGGHRVTFQHPQRGTLDVGRVDFDATREVVARWP